MRSAKGVGRAMGILMLVQGVLGATVNFGLLGASITGPPGFLTNAAAHSTRVSLAAILMIVAGALSIANSTIAWPVFRRHSERMALWFFGLSIAGFALAVVESATVMSMLSLSQEYLRSGGTAGTFDGAAMIARYAKYWAHYTHLLVGSGSLIVLYTTLFRFSLVPRLLAGLGIAAVLLQMTGLLMPFFGSRINFLLLAPMGICHLILAVWLIVKGLSDGNIVDVSDA